MKDKIILDLCSGSGSWSHPYDMAGYDVRCCTLPDCNIRIFSPPNGVYGILAAPPCTEFSRAKRRKGDHNFGMEIVSICLDIIKKCNPVFWALENPIGDLPKYLGKPSYMFHPWWFGDPWTKLTYLWGQFNKPEILYNKWEDVPKIEGLYIRPGREKPSLACQHLGHKKLIHQMDGLCASDDAEFRAITPPGFAKAFFKANQ